MSRTRKSPSPSQLKILDLLNEGFRPNYISETLSIPYSRIYSTCQRFDWPTNPPLSKTLCRAYELLTKAGVPLHDIAIILNCSPAYLAQNLTWEETEEEEETPCANTPQTEAPLNA